MSFSKLDATRHPRKGNSLKQIDQLIDWNLLEKAVAVHYAPVSDEAGRLTYSGMLLIKPRIRAACEVVNGREERNDETRCQTR